MSTHKSHLSFSPITVSDREFDNLILHGFYDYQLDKLIALLRCKEQLNNIKQISKHNKEDIEFLRVLSDYFLSLDGPLWLYLTGHFPFVMEEHFVYDIAFKDHKRMYKSPFNPQYSDNIFSTVLKICKLYLQAYKGKLNDPNLLALGIGVKINSIISGDNQLVIIDCDNEAAKDELIKKVGVLNTFTIKTPKGYHFYCSTSSTGLGDKRLVCNGKSGKLDIFTGGFIITSPSPGYEVINDTLIAECPPAVINTLKKAYNLAYKAPMSFNVDKRSPFPIGQTTGMSSNSQDHKVKLG